jgi:hypothetical protein
VNIISALRSGNAVSIDGLLVKACPGQDIAPGDVYIAERNTGPHLLTAKSVDRRLGCIFPRELAYPYNLDECVRVC